MIAAWGIKVVLKANSSKNYKLKFRKSVSKFRKVASSYKVSSGHNQCNYLFLLRILVAEEGFEPPTQGL